MAAKRNHLAVWVIAISLFFATLLSVGVFFLVRFANRSAEAARFEGHIRDYLTIPKEQFQLGEYLRGQVVAIDVGTREVDEDVFFDLPAGLRAATPEEVGTVVLLKWGTKMVGMYTGPNGFGGVADAQTCEVTVIDRSIPAVVARRSFQGHDPPTHYNGTRTGPKPVEEVVNFLTGLPHEAGREGAAPRSWTVLFRSDDPSVWNTSRRGTHVAVPARQAHSAIRFLRLKRMDTGQALIVPITRDQLAREDRPRPAQGVWWNGSGEDHFGARHLGLVQASPAPTSQRGTLGISGHDFEWWTGSGFGHKLGVDDRQIYCWQGKEIPKTVFEIAVATGPLTEEEQRCLVAGRH
jgi:hypothetical protein